MSLQKSALRSGKPSSPASFQWDAELSRRVREALEEDLGSGDVTTRATVAAKALGRGEIIAKAKGVFCGAPVADRVWKLRSPKIKIDWLAGEGSAVKPGMVVARLSGPYRALLEGERVALNFLQQLSGVATMTRELVDATGGGGAKPQVCDTRKTTPLWRKLERYAVRAGGGTNHRFGLFDMVLIKENHARAAGGVGPAVRLARKANPKLKIGAEARDLAEVSEAFWSRADLILLDNMTPAQVKAIVKRYGGRGTPLEISGGITPKNAPAYARAGADRLSSGGLTHSPPALDLSLQLYPAESRD